ncbi:FMN-binding negative transcriptional regulator [Segetibacter aerophilus]|uniref:Protease synthase and sporulation protein PAI 2 n=1 Tax=Segetibacter aerophilus TaxID=670293 RepID=A0A512BHA9_9BACT|nr:FMN-binding negative transcriptional regulator [Segetibacter aerophilus]GEO11265.1 protease synthase and sporulation protein PAI 2 [Segetibacter aerophilus]
MYNIPYYKAEDEKEVIDFMRHHPFIVLTGVNANHHPVATHIPVLIEEREEKIFLLAHVVRQSDHHKAFVQNPQVLAIFSGPHAYVSASWYTNQQQASTWNYQAVHAKGQLKFLNDEGLLNILHRLTEQFENNAASPSLVENLEGEYVRRLTKAIVGFEIEVTEIAHIFKLSQNRDKESYNNIIQHLKDGDSEAKLVASIMEKRGNDD